MWVGCKDLWENTCLLVGAHKHRSSPEPPRFTPQGWNQHPVFCLFCIVFAPLFMTFIIAPLSDQEGTQTGSVYRFPHGSLVLPVRPSHTWKAICWGCGRERTVAIAATEPRLPQWDLWAEHPGSRVQHSVEPSLSATWRCECGDVLVAIELCWWPSSQCENVFFLMCCLSLPLEQNTDPHPSPYHSVLCLQAAGHQEIEQCPSTNPWMNGRMDGWMN